jgi:SNF2 family DNA or RNA helicase
VLTAHSYHLLTVHSVFEHKISGKLRHVPPCTSAGGVLADVMGLGKTLTMISAIIHSKDEGVCFALPSSKFSVDDDLTYPLKATLVVTPSARKYSQRSLHPHRTLILLELIEVWKSEIQL